MICYLRFYSDGEGATNGVQFPENNIIFNATSDKPMLQFSTQCEIEGNTHFV